jgi:predicted molibdopterin-dependent oxidoreductase YjgC
VANLIIPAKTFLEKSDIRFSYGSERVTEMPQVKESSIGISEYALTKYLCNSFNFSLETQENYLDHFSSFIDDFEDVKRLKNMPKIAYENGFLTDEEKFIFLDDVDHSMQLESNELFLVTNSSKTSLNSQFKRQNCIYLHKSFGFKDGDSVKIISNIGEVVLEVKNSDTIREDCVMIYKGTKGLNNLTPSILSYEGMSAAFQDIRVKIEKV